MSNFPTGLPGLKTDFDSADLIASADQNDQANEINAVGAKVGINGSAVTTSHDYKLSGVTGTDKAVSKTGTETLTNKTLTSPTITGPTITGTIGGTPAITTPVIVSLYQDAGKTKLVTMPAASDTLVGKATTDTLTNKTLTSPTLTSPVLNTAVSGTAVLDEDTMSSDSNTKVATQQSIKAYADTKLLKASPVVSSGDLDIPDNSNITEATVDPYKTISLSARAWQPTTTAGCAAVAQIEAGTNDIDYDVLDFDASTDENAYVNFVMPGNWDAGVIQFRYIWTNAGGGASETTTLELSGGSLGDSDAIDTAVGTAVERADTWLAQGDVHISAWSNNVTIANAAAGELVHLEIMRDVSEDNLTGDLRLIEVQIRYKESQYNHW